MQRIWIIGASGCGKTTLGRLIAEKLKIDAIDLDELHWLPDWQTVPVAHLTEMVETATSQDKWVISGNYRSQQHFLPRADTLVWLDYGFTIVLSRLLKRTFRRVLWREPCCNGNRETLSRTFSRDSVILWLLQTYRKRKRLGMQTVDAPQHSHLQILHFKKPQQTEDWLKTLPDF